MKGKARPRMGAAVAVAALITALGFASLASAASPIGADGSIHGCYVAKGKHRGSLRLLSAGKKCQKRKHEKPIVWSVQGPQGSPGQSGISTDQLNTLTERINQQDATIASLN